MRAKRKQQQKKRNRKKIFKRILFVSLLLVFSLGAYVYMQYRSGVQGVQKVVDETEQEDYEFNGKKDQYGGTNILLLGSDTRDNGRGNADTIMIVHYNSSKGTYKLTSIMRDVYVDIPGVGKRKINAAQAHGGPELLRQTIKENFDIDIQYYTMVDFEGFIHIVDELFPGGIEVDVQKEMSENIGVTIKPGVQKLDGKHLLGYVRFRNDSKNDFGRVARQQEVINKVADELMTIHGVTKAPKLIGVVTPFIHTNLQTSNMMVMGKDYVFKQKGSIETFRIPVEGTFTNNRISGVGEVLDIDLEKNKEALHEFIRK